MAFEARDEMSDDSKSKKTKTEPAATDGWVEPPVDEAPDAPLVPTRQPEKLAATDELWTTKSDSPGGATGVPLPARPGVEEKPPKPEPLSDIGPDRAMSILAHTSILLALPVFLVPMLQRQNSLSLQHSKAAGVNFIFFTLFGIAALLTKGLAVPLMFLCYIPSLVGIVNAANGEKASFWAMGPLGERVFKSQPKDDATTPKRLSNDD